jgi:hypothetical protein
MCLISLKRVTFLPNTALNKEKPLPTLFLMSFTSISAENKNEWSYNPAVPIYLHGVDRDKFTMSLFQRPICFNLTDNYSNSVTRYTMHIWYILSDNKYYLQIICTF